MVGCLFHYAKAVLSQAKRKGLWSFYCKHFGEKNDVWRWLRRICALPLLPVELIRPIWDMYLHEPPRAPPGWVPPKGYQHWPDNELEVCALA